MQLNKEMSSKEEFDNQILLESKTGTRFKSVVSSKAISMDKMEFICKSALSGKLHTQVLSITEEQFDFLCKHWLKSITEVCPSLTPAEREFLLSGVTSEEWDEVFPDDDDDVEDPPAKKDVK